MQFSVQNPWGAGGAGAPIPVPARWVGDGGAQSGHHDAAVRLVGACVHPPPPSPQPSQPPGAADLGFNYRDALKTAQQREREAYMTYTPGPSVPNAGSLRRGIPAPTVGMKYEGGSTGREHRHGTPFTAEEASERLRAFQLWHRCYGWTRALGYFLAVVVLLMLAVVADVLPLDAAADAVDPSREHGSALRKLERKLKEQQKQMDVIKKERDDMQRKLHKKLRKKTTTKQAGDAAEEELSAAGADVSELAHQEAVVEEFMRGGDPPSREEEEEDAVLEVTRSAAALEAARRRQEESAEKLMRRVSHDLEAVHQLPADVLRHAVKHGVGGTAVEAAVKVSERKKSGK